MDWNLTYLIITLYGNLIILILLVSSFFKRNYKNILTILSIIVLALIISLRNSKVALDTPKYVELFLRNDINFFNQEYVYEIGFIFFNKLIYLYTDNYHLFLFFITFTHLSIILILYRKLSEKFFPLLLAMYISTFVFWLSNLSMLRQGLAIPVMALSVYYLIFQDNKKMFFLLSFIAGSIHFSSIPISLFVISSYYLYKKLRIFILKIFLFTFIFLTIYPENIFMNIILKIISLFSQYKYSSINKIVWYFNWNKLHLWHIKHVYFLIVLLFTIVGIIEKNRKNLLLLLIPTSLLAIFKYDEMVTDRLFMYFVPLIPYITLHFFFKIYPRRKYEMIFVILLIAFGMLVWFNIKFIYLQYAGWFIYPYPYIR